QPVVVVRDRGERLRARAGAELRELVRDVAELVDGQQPAGELEILELLLAPEREDLVREQVLAREAVRANGAGALQVLPFEGALLLLVLERQRIGQFAVVAWIARVGGVQRMQPQVFLPEVRVQPAERRRAVAVRGARGAGDPGETDQQGWQGGPGVA